MRLSVNPIIVKELRSRMRGARAFIIMTGVLLLLGGVSYALYRVVLATVTYTRTPVSPQIGQTLFAALAFLELLMICFVTPAVTAGTISGEWEQLTHEMLLTTPLRPASILRGKLISALSYVFLLLFAAVPMASVVFMFGGVAPRDMLKALVVLSALAVTLGMVGLFFSAWLKRTVRATVLSYLFVLLLLIGPVFVYALVGVLRGAEPPRWILIANPVSALFSSVAPSVPSDGLGGVLWGLGMALGGNLGVITGMRVPSGIPRPIYHYTLPLYGLLTLVLYFLAVRLVQPVRRWRPGRRELLAALALILVLAGATALAWGLTAGRYERAGDVPTPTPAPFGLSGVQPAVEVVEVERVVVVEPTPPLPPTPTWTPTPAVVPLPSPTPTPFEPEILPWGDEEQAHIYALVLRQLLAAGQGLLAELPDPPVIHLQPTTRDGLVDPVAPVAASRPLAPSLQAATLDELADVDVDFAWDARPPDTRAPIIILGNLHPLDDGAALVSASLYVPGLGSVGRVFRLERAGGTWRLEEN
ncbi:MAG: ABC transporter permease subunit [Anaerolineae bacterium]